jgi:hypothetical protein
MPAAVTRILAALPLRQRPGLYLHPEPDAKGNRTSLERGEDPDDGPAGTPMDEAPVPNVSVTFPRAGPSTKRRGINARSIDG